MRLPRRVIRHTDAELRKGGVREARPEGGAVEARRQYW